MQFWPLRVLYDSEPLLDMIYWPGTDGVFCQGEESIKINFVEIL